MCTGNCCCSQIKPKTKLAFQQLPVKFESIEKDGVTFTPEIHTPILYLPKNTFPIVPPRKTPGANQTIQSAPNVTYKGGPILTNVEVVPIFWGSQWNTNPLNSFVGEIYDFFKTILSSCLMDLLNQDYSVPGQTIQHGTVIEPIIIDDPSTPLPSKTVDDSLIQFYINVWGWILSLIPQSNSQTLYFVYLPPNITLTLGTDTSCVNMCGYHLNTDFINSPNSFYYAVIPYPCCTLAGCCDSGAGDFATLTMISSHELCEAITDPDWLGQNGWFDRKLGPLGEIGDLCLWEPATIDGYMVQKMWSRLQQACVIAPQPRVSLPEGSVLGTPALSSSNQNIFLSWTGKWDRRLNIAATVNPPFSIDCNQPNFTSSVLLETSIDGPAITMGPGNKLWLAWTGTDPIQHLNILSTSDYSSFLYSKYSFPHDSSSHGPAIAFVPPDPSLPATLQNRLYIAYVASDPGRHIYIISSPDGIHWDRRTKINEWTDAPPSLSFAHGKLHLLFRAFDSSHTLFILESNDGINFNEKFHLIGESSNYAPALSGLDDEDLVVWSGTDSRQTINWIRTRTDLFTEVPSPTFWNDRANTGVAVTQFALPNSATNFYIAWAGTDPANTLNFMQLLV